MANACGKLGDNLRESKMTALSFSTDGSTHKLGACGRHPPWQH